MKKVFVYAVCAALLASSCDSYTGAGAYTGSYLGSILGSAIGGISDGPRGSDIGTIVGMAGGAAVGAAIGSAADKKEAERYENYRRQREANRSSRYTDDENYSGADDSGFDANNRGDDRIEFDAPGPRTQAQSDTAKQSIKEIRITSSSPQNGGQQKPSFSLQPLQP